MPKLFVNAEPGAIVHGRIRDLIRSWPNLTETTVTGLHFVQEDSPDEIGTAVAQFVRTLALALAAGSQRYPMVLNCPDWAMGRVPFERAE